MEDDIRKDLKLLCYEILENVKTESLTEQLTHVQMLYERLLVLNYLSENPDKLEHQTPDASATRPPQSPTVAEAQTESLDPEPSRDEHGSAKTSYSSETSTQEESSPSSATQEAPSTNEKSTPPPKEENPPESDVQPQATDQGDTPPPLEKPASPAEKASEPKPKPTEPQETPPQTQTPDSPQKSSTYNVPPPGYEQKRSLNDRLAKGSIDIGLNDRLAFVKHLFGGAQEDFNRVLSQLNTFTSLREAEDFLDQVVKPDYDWSEKEEYEDRLRELIRKRYGEEDAP